MILFQEDFADQGAILHTNTKNISFLKMYALLKTMGIKNNAFFLAVTQKDLLHIDPHTLKDPSEELAARIVYECKVNPWYWFREVCRVPAAGTDPIPFILHRGNLALVWTFYNNIDVYLVIPRQCGKTISTQSIVGHLMYFGTKRFNMAMLTKDTTLLQENVDRLKDIRDAIPPYMLYRNKLADTDRKEGLSYAKLNNKYQTFVNREDELGAYKLGRGMSTPCQHWDEFEFFKNIRISYPAALPATGTARAQAAAVGLPHANIITSTAGRLDSDEGKFAAKIIGNAMRFSENLYDCKNKEELRDILNKNSTIGMIYAVFSYLQLGKTHEWFKVESARSNGTKEEIERDYLNYRRSGTSDGIVSSSIMDKIRKSVIDPVQTELNLGYVFRWYQKPDYILKSKINKRPLIMGLDTSENVGQDFTSLCIIDPTDMSVVCTARCNESDLVKFAKFIGQFLYENEQIILVPERKSTGSMIISIICNYLRSKGINPFMRIYNEVYQQRQDPKFQTIDTTTSEAEEGAAKKFLGFVTTGGSGERSRDFLYRTTLTRTLEMNASRINDQTLADELLQLTIKNGRIDHKDGLHDDMVIAYLLACWFALYAKNLHLYKLNRSDFFTQISATGAKVDPNVKKAQLEITERIKEVKVLLQKMQHPAVRNSLTRELNNLESLLDEEILEQESIRSDDVGNSNKGFNPGYLRTMLNKFK